jgi:hypothetical protein
MESKNLPIPEEIPSEIKELSRQIEQWRKDPARGRRIPEHLWISAVKIARNYGAGRVARCLRLDFYSLKERMRCGTETASPKQKPAFIELPAFPSAAVPECSIEVEHPRNGRMRIHVKGTAMPDLASITRVFCGGDK